MQEFDKPPRQKRPTTAVTPRAELSVRNEHLQMMDATKSFENGQQSERYRNEDEVLFTNVKRSQPLQTADLLLMPHTRDQKSSMIIREMTQVSEMAKLHMHRKK